MNPKHKHHIFFFSDNQSITKTGIYRIGATEITIFNCHQELEMNVKDLEKEFSIHKPILPNKTSLALDIIRDHIEAIINEDMLLCINLNNNSPVLSQYTVLVAQEKLEEFHSAYSNTSRPTLEPFTTGLYYKAIDGKLSGLPIIPKTPVICSVIYNLLLRNEEWLGKEEIKSQLHLIDDSITLDKITNALIILENWLGNYPGFDTTQKKQRRKEYRIRELSEI
ncbi:MAG: hypothetical protein ACTSO7_11215 [Candidatus Heimdallarchaeota archaeon]